MFKFLKNRKGFTLVELMIVITVIAVLSTIGIIAFSGVQANARDAKRKGDLHNMANALSAYYNGVSPSAYPTAANLSTALQTYGGVPVDPKNSGTYVYVYKPGDGTNTNTAGTATFLLCATLESGTQWVVTSQNLGGTTSGTACASQTAL